MNLLVISHTPHYRQGAQVVGWGPTIREIDQLAARFDHVYHLAVLYEEPAPLSSLPYTADNISFMPVRPAGGETLAAKLDVLRAYFGYWKTIRRAINTLNKEDIIHVRCPANISLLAVIYLIFTRKNPRRWVKYAGNWKPKKAENFSYMLQRWISENNMHRGIVTINGQWQGQPQHIYSFLNPSLRVNDLKNIAKPTIKPPYQLLFVGRVEEAKGVGRLLEIGSILQKRKIEVRINIVGDGPEKVFFKNLTQKLNLSKITIYHGWQPKPALEKFYREAHFFILPTNASEGWPKVLSEAMAYGVVPLAGAVSSIPQILQECETGMALDPLDTQSFANAICDYINDPSRWNTESRAAQQASCQFTYEAYLEHLTAVFEEKWQVNLIR